MLSLAFRYPFVFFDRSDKNLTYFKFYLWIPETYTN